MHKPRVIVVGAGLTGSAFVPSMCAHITSSKLDAVVVLIDHDVIEERNSPANLGVPGNIGEFKVGVVSEYLKMAYIDYSVLTTKITDKNKWLLKEAEVIVGAVDNNKTRKTLLAAAEEYGIPYMDIGVSAVSGIVSWRSADGAYNNMPKFDSVTKDDKVPACALVGTRAIAVITAELAAKSLMLFLRGHDPSGMADGLFGRRAEGGMMVGWHIASANEYLAVPFAVGIDNVNGGDNV